MITDEDYDVLYYVTPKQYRATALDQQQYDPKAMENLNKEEVLEELLLKCTLSELISTLIIIFKEKYANPLPVWTGIVDYEIKTKKESSKRKDIKKIQFDFKYGVETVFGANTEYLDNVFMEFSEPLQTLKSIIKTGLKGKSFTEETSHDKTILTIANSPITKIELTPATFCLFIDKNSFIDYGQ